MKRILCVFFTLLLMAAACACSTTPPETAAGGISGLSNQKIGISMPSRNIQRWVREGDLMKMQLEALGCTVDLQYAEDDTQAQASQLENMLTAGADCLVVAAIDSTALLNVLEQANAANVPVVGYERLLLDTEAIRCLITFDNRAVGLEIGHYIEQAKGLKDGNGPFNIEFYGGIPEDDNARRTYDGVFEVLQPYLDSGQLVCGSGQTDFDVTCIPGRAQEGAQKRMENLLSGFYSTGKDVDIVVSTFDGYSYGIAAALESAGYAPGKKWPLVTGQDGETMAIKNILSGRQTQTIFKDTRILAEKCVGMVQALLTGREPETNDTTTYDNHKLVVPAYICTPVSVDKENVKKEVVDSGYYTAEDLGLG